MQIAIKMHFFRDISNATSENNIKTCSNAIYAMCIVFKVKLNGKDLVISYDTGFFILSSFSLVITVKSREILIYIIIILFYVE